MTNESEERRKKRLGLGETGAPERNEDDPKLKDIRDTCQQHGLGPLRVDGVVDEVLRCYGEVRDYDSSTLRAHSMPWDEAAGRVLTPKQMMQAVYKAWQDAQQGRR